MINASNIEPVDVPGRQLTSRGALTCTLIHGQLCSLSKGYPRLPFRPMIDFSIFIITFYLLLQGLTELGFFK